MNDPQRDNLEREIASLTEWQGDTGDLWRSALAESKRAGGDVEPFVMRLRRNWRVAALAASLMLLSAIAIVLVAESSRGNATRYARSSQVLMSPASKPPANRIDLSEAEGVGGGGGGSSASDGYPARVPSDQGASAAEARQIIRKATIELEVVDVRASFIKVQHIISAARGEFIDDSSLTGSEPHTLRGTLTLRVEAARLPDVLNELRQLGAVVSEKIAGEDVTMQMVDLDARLRNEKRIEQELLKLLDTRAEAPLGEVMEVRRQLDGVRLRIEQFTGQQQRLTRQVAFAAVLVFLRPASDMPAPPTESGMLDHLRESLGEAFRKGVLALINSVAALLSLMIGGLLWWLALALGTWLLWTRLLRP
ncbi:MAG TPA: DUF4349 domain-containing protein [Phycisphaerales bacterium]|nr:DUF4349 domain-containing protein [Phycisphaerales bacterium]HRQ75663.1 DUF4349 domain-containing protein [Phycisphaerales bacterium]